MTFLFQMLYWTTDGTLYGLKIFSRSTIETIPQKSIEFIFSVCRHFVPWDQNITASLREVVFMKIGFVGAGKVGFSLGKYFCQKGLAVAGFFSKNPKSAIEAAEFTGTEKFDTMKQIAEVSDVLFLTVPDGQVIPVWEQLKEYNLAGKIISHCSGALSSTVFSGSRKAGASCYSAHPFLAVSDKFYSYQDFQNALFTIEGSPEEMDKMCGLFLSCGNKVQKSRPEDKMRYHAAASVASNFMVTLAFEAQKILEQSGFSEKSAKEALSYLMRQNLDSIIQRGPAAALTGPIERGDAGTVKGHISVLAPKERLFYIPMARATLSLAKEKHPGRDYQELEELLK